MGDSGLGVTILAVSWAETGIGLAFFILRAISNWMFVRRLRWDFALAILTVVRLFSVPLLLRLTERGR
jgi:hypothetical protein